VSSPVESNLLVRGLERATEMLQSVRDYLVDDEARAATLREMGLDPKTELPAPQFSEPQSLPENFAHSDWLDRLAVLVKLADEIKGFIDRAHTNPEEAVADEVFALLSLEYFRLKVPAVYFIAEAGGFLLESIELGRIPKTAIDGVESTVRQFGQFLENPIDKVVALAKAVRDFPFETDADARRAADVVFTAIALLPLMFGLKSTQSQYGWDAEPDSTAPQGDSLAERALAFRVAFGSDATRIMPAFAWQFVPTEHGGPGMLLSFSGSVEQTWQIGESWDAKLKIVTPGQLDVFLHPGWKPDFAVNGISDPSGQAEASFSIVRRADKLDPPTLGLNDGVRIEFGDPSVIARVSAQGASLSVRAAKTALVIDGEADPITERTMPKGGWRGNADLDLTLLPEASFRGSGGLEAHIPFTEGVGPVEVPYLLLGIRRSAGQEGLTVELSAAMTVRLGPITLTLDRVGLNFTFTSWRDVDAGFQSPRGVGVAVDAKGTVKGGGFLTFDSDKHQYAGIIDLQLTSGTIITAIGVLTTKPVFSLLVILTSENLGTPTMGPGFNLTGIGGILGLDRTVDMEVLKQGIANKTLDRIMFPPDPIANAPAVISTSASVFPASRGHFIVGIMAQFTWGLGKLLTIEIAFILELPEPARFVILGKLRLIVPDPDHALVRIQIDLVGEIDFNARRAFVLAKLVDSKLTRFDLKGAAALYIDWGDNPTFILSFGGFNPRYHLPQGVPPELSTLERLSVSLARDKNLELTFTAYLAFTSNTFQIGGSVHALASAGKFSIEGFLSVEALIDRNEGKFFIDLEARLQLKAWGVNLFMVSFKGTLDGPSPVRLKGKATFSIWIFDYSVPISVSLGSITAPVVAAADVLGALVSALQSQDNWSTDLPPGAQAAVTLRPRPGETEFALHPLGVLSIRQSVVPLGSEIERFGPARPQGATLFQITSVSVREQGAQTAVVQEHFARSEFFDLSEDQAFGGPSFERMPAGVNVGSTAVSSGPAVTLELGYRTLVYDAATDTMQPADDYALPDGHLNVLMRIGAAALKASSYSGPPRRVEVVAPRWVIASVEDFTKQTMGQIAAEGTTYTAASRALRRHVEANPALAEDLTIASSEVAA
jgi:Family of unknown function (DUF6603)